MPAQIRLKRVGRKKQPSFRIVVADSSTAVTGPAIEELGVYHPRTSPSFIRLNAERTLHWLHSGAMPTDTVRSILRKTGLWEKYHEGLKPGQLPEEARRIVLGPAEGRRGTSHRVAAAAAAREEAAEAAETEAAAPEAGGEPAATETAVAEPPAEETEEEEETSEAGTGEKPAAEAEAEAEEDEETGEDEEEKDA